MSGYWATYRLGTDGKGLEEVAKVPKAHSWLLYPSKLLSGHDFIMCVKLRFNALSVKSRTTRERAQLDRSCGAGCRAPETLNHFLQQCHHTHRPQLDRHNSAASYIERNLTSKGWRTLIEPVVKAGQNNLKPDLIALKDSNAVIIDAQVITDSFPLDVANPNKISKYSRAVFRRKATRYGTNNLKTVAVILN